MWGTPVNVWVGEPASIVHIHNVYRGSGPERATQEREWRNVAEAELKQWTTGRRIHVHADNPAELSDQPVLEVNNVEGSVMVMIGHETLTGVVSASSVAGERTIPAAA